MAPPETMTRFSSSEIAKSPESFSIWAQAHDCVPASMKDLPPRMRRIVQKIFNISGRLPSALIDTSCETHQQLAQLTPELVPFLQRAERANPTLFSRTLDPGSAKFLVSDLCGLHAAHVKLKKLSRQSMRPTEAEFASQVYSAVRNTIRRSRMRQQKAVSLPKPSAPASHFSNSKGQLLDVVSAHVAIPDGMLFIPEPMLEKLSENEMSAYHVLHKHSRRTPFAANTTPCDELPQRPTPEFVSCVWEDKAACTEIEHAYRQNRMATAAVACHLHALGVEAPVIGLVWAEGTVRAHVDWAEIRDGKRVVCSARYYPPTVQRRRESSSSSSSALPKSRGWHLSSPADMLAVYLLLQNVDNWTTSGFHKLVIEGVEGLASRVQAGNAQFVPWKVRKANQPVAFVDVDYRSSPQTSDPSSPQRSSIKKTRRKVGNKSLLKENDSTTTQDPHNKVTLQSPSSNRRVLRPRN